MASTNKKNSIGNYSLEQYSLKKQNEYKLYGNAPNGRAINTHFAGNGLLGGRVAPTELSYHSADIESFLRGVGSSNLVTDREPVYGELETGFIRDLGKTLGVGGTPIKNIASLNLFENPTVFVPSPIKMEREPRPLIR